MPTLVQTFKALADPTRLRMIGLMVGAQQDDRIEKIHSDFCTIRREFIMGKYMERERSKYRLTSRGCTVLAE